VVLVVVVIVIVADILFSLNMVCDGWMKVEMVKITTPEQSDEEHHKLTEHAEACLKVGVTIDTYYYHHHHHYYYYYYYYYYYPMMYAC